MVIGRIAGALPRSEPDVPVPPALLYALRHHCFALVACIAIAAAVGCGGGLPAGADPSGTAGAGGDVTKAGPPVGAPDGLTPGDRPPEFVGLAGWVNSEPLTLKALRSQGRVVLIDFWTYTCVNCQRTLPYLRAWDEKYRAHGLTIIGVHSPEFEFEQAPANVVAAVRTAGLAYPVAIDSEMATWRAWANHVWPATYLIGGSGVVRYVHLGEGGYDASEAAIRAALSDAGWDVSAVPSGSVAAPTIDPAATVLTRALYGGYEQNVASGGVYAAQDDYFLGSERVGEYTDPGDHGHNQWYLQGSWRSGREAVVHARATTALDDYFSFRFIARSVNVVLGPAPAGAYDVVVELDGRPLRPDEAGADVRFDADGRSVMRVGQARMYAIAELPAIGDHELTLRSNADGFAVYAVTFGAYEDGA